MRESLKMAKITFEDRPVIAVEVGVAAGANAQKIFDNLNIKKLALIDNWNQAYNEKCLEWLKETKQRFANNQNVEIIRHEAITASELFASESIDYLYIDDNHAPIHVYKELCAWYGRVKSGGIIAGRDWADNGRASAAVMKFCEERRITYYHAPNKGEQVADWWFFKP